MPRKDTETKQAPKQYLERNKLQPNRLPPISREETPAGRDYPDFEYRLPEIGETLPKYSSEYIKKLQDHDMKQFFWV